MNREMLLANGWVGLLAGAALGAVAGMQIPACARYIINNKCKKLSKPVPDGAAADRTTVLVTILSDAALSALAAVSMRPAAAVAAFCILQVALACVIVDRAIRIIANETVLLLLALGILFRILSGGFSSLLGSLEALGLVTALFAGSAALMAFLKGRPGVGAGDLKYAMALSVAVGWPGVLHMLLCFAAAVLLYIFIGMKYRILTMNTYFPMCLHLSVGLLGGLFLPLFLAV